MPENKRGACSWKKVLRSIYGHGPHRYGTGKGQIKDDHPLAKDTGLKGADVDSSLIFLHEMQLIEYEGANSLGASIALTEKGFNVALENEKIKESSLLGSAILLFTAMAAMTAAFSFVHEIYPNYNSIQFSVIYLVGIFGIYFAFLKMVR